MLLVALGTLGCAPSAHADSHPPVAVASSLRAAWPALEAAWRRSLPTVGARPTFGASRTLARQIRRGAPFELLLAADAESIDVLPPGRVAPGGARPYALGRLVLLVREPDGTARDDDAARDPLSALGSRLASDPSFRIALANPGHAPYGLAARQALDDAKLWPIVPARLALAENAAQALQFLLAGAVDAAFVPGALLVGGAPPGTRAHPVEPTRHAPLVHALVVVDGASPAARALADWFVSDAARDALAAAGFDAPP